MYAWSDMLARWWPYRFIDPVIEKYNTLSTHFKSDPPLLVIMTPLPFPVCLNIHLPHSFKAQSVMKQKESCCKTFWEIQNDRLFNLQQRDSKLCLDTIMRPQEGWPFNQVNIWHTTPVSVWRTHAADCQCVWRCMCVWSCRTPLDNICPNGNIKNGAYFK